MSSLPLDAADTSASQRERAVIATACPPLDDQSTAQAAAICRALSSTLLAASPAAIPRTMADLSQAPTRPGDIAVALRIEAQSDDRIKGYLEWRQGNADWQRGQSLEMTVMDGTLSPAVQAQFAQDLLRVTPDLASALQK